MFEIAFYWMIPRSQDGRTCGAPFRVDASNTASALRDAHKQMPDVEYWTADAVYTRVAAQHSISNLELDFGCAKA